VVITFLASNQRTGNVAYLFRVEPSGVIHIWSDAPDILIAAARSAGDGGPMAKKRAANRRFDRRAGVDAPYIQTSCAAIGSVRQQTPDESRPSGKSSLLRIVTDRVERAEVWAPNRPRWPDNKNSRLEISWTPSLCGAG